MTGETKVRPDELSGALRTMLTDPQYPPLTINQALTADDHGWLDPCGYLLNSEGLALRAALLSEEKGTNT